MSDVEAMRQHFARREAERAQSVTAHVRELRASIPGLVEQLVARWGAQRVWLFGSLAWGDAHAESDIDLAVEGLAPEHYFGALGELLAASPAAVDLLTLEDAPAELRARILSEGRLLHGG